MNDYENAVLNYSHAIRLNPKSAETYFDRGTAYEMLRRYDAALSDYRKAATLKYRVSDVYFHIRSIDCADDTEANNFIVFYHALDDTPQ